MTRPTLSFIIAVCAAIMVLMFSGSTVSSLTLPSESGHHALITDQQATGLPAGENNPEITHQVQDGIKLEEATADEAPYIARRRRRRPKPTYGVIFELKNFSNISWTGSFLTSTGKRYYIDLRSKQQKKSSPQKFQIPVSIVKLAIGTQDYDIHDGGSPSTPCMGNPSDICKRKRGYFKLPLYDRYEKSINIPITQNNQNIFMSISNGGVHVSSGRSTSYRWK